MDREISGLFEKTAKVLASNQNSDGCWSIEKIEHNQPREYQKDLVLTSQALQTLILIGLEDTIGNIGRGMEYCLNYELEKNDPLPWWAWKLSAIKFFKTERAKKEKEKILKLLISKQDKKGYWPSFLGTFNLTNFSIIKAIYDQDCEKSLNLAIKWFKKNRAKDKKGWDKDGEAERSERTFTSNILISLILAGEDPTAKYLQKAKRLLEEGQRSNGGWESSSLTVRKVTSYSTAVSTLSLMLLSKNPFNQKVEKGIALLKKMALPNGGWPLIKGEEINYYSTYYAVFTLSFYKYLKEKFKDKNIKWLLKDLPMQKVVSFLFRSFERYVGEKLNRKFINAVIYSNALGSTINAIQRRKDILNILDRCGSKDVAGIIDELKKDSKYSYLNKKHYITQIKSDLEHMKNMKLVGKIHDLYFIQTKC